jgi:hypothetical protein
LPAPDEDPVMLGTKASLDSWRLARARATSDSAIRTRGLFESARLTEEIREI